MKEQLVQRRAARLEGLCDDEGADLSGAGARIRIGRASLGIERLEARFGGQAFSPHRHDTYAIGVTLAGVQTFTYRGARRYCLPGQCHVLHPDETHDGAAGTETGFFYRIAYIDPALLQPALGGKPLPFVADPILDLRAFHGALPPALWQPDEPIDDVARIEIVAAVADLLLRVAGTDRPTPSPLRLDALLRIRDLIAADPAKRHSMAKLETVSGLDRWALARQFRACFGTSPSNFRTMRQLDVARRRIRGGMPLAASALAAGFADQSHMSRMFKRRYGLTPGKWQAALV